MKRKSGFRDQRGTSFVEFALILPLLVILLFGVIEFGIILYDKAVLTNASREGARAGIVQKDPRMTFGEIKAIVDNYSKNYLITFSSGTTLPDTVVTGAGGAYPNPLTVTVTYSYGFLVLPNFITTLTGQINLSATTVMRME